MKKIKTMKKIKVIILLFTSIFVNAQVGIGTTGPNSTLDVMGKPSITSIADGIIAPRLKRSELVAKTAYSTNQTGAIVYITDTSGTTNTATNDVTEIGYYYFNGVSWKGLSKTDVSTGSSKWENITGTNNLIRLKHLSDGSTVRPADNGIFINDNGNIGIGVSDINNYAKLDVKSSNQGILIPRLSLTSNTMDLNADGDNNIVNQPSGLMLYNTGGTFPSGFYYWNGTEWRILNNSLVKVPSILALDCTNFSIEPATFTNGTPFNGTLTVSYTGGNGGSYPAGTSFTQNGLTFVLLSGTLNNGNGNLLYSVTGTPDFTSPTTRDIPISFDGKSCNVTIGAGKTTIQTLQFATKSVSPLDSNTPTNSRLNFGNVSIRLAHTGTGGGAIQFTTSVATHYTARTNLYGSGGGGDGGGTIVGAITSPGTWVNFSGLVNPTNKDIAIINLVLQTTKEVYRITVNTNGNLTNPSSTSQGSIFVEKLN